MGQLSDAWTSWSMLWTLVPLSNRTRDISDLVNAEVEKANGNAVVNLSMKSAICVSNVITVVGLLPGCTDVEIAGDIIRALPARTTAATGDPAVPGS